MVSKCVVVYLYGVIYDVKFDKKEKRMVQYDQTMLSSATNPAGTLAMCMDHITYARTSNRTRERVPYRTRTSGKKGWKTQKTKQINKILNKYMTPQ